MIDAQGARRLHHEDRDHGHGALGGDVAGTGRHLPSLKAGNQLATGSVSWSVPSSTSIIAATDTMGLVIE
jgi:hypothetical protein